jgi:hypothetical protein
MLTIAVGGPRPAYVTSGSGGWDFVLPLLVFASLLLLRFVGEIRITAITAAIAFVLGTIWAWFVALMGPLRSTALIVLLCFALGQLVPRRPRRDSEGA